MNRKAGQVKEIILEEIDKREDDLRSYIPDYSTLEDHPFFTELLSGNLKTAYKLAKSRALKQVIAQIGQSIDAKLKGANDASVVEEIRQYILSTDKFDRMIESIIKNQAKHMIKGLWTDEGGVKVFSGLVTRAIPFYRKDNPYSTHIPPRVSRSIKTKAAQALLDWYFGEIEEKVEEMGGVYDMLDMEWEYSPKLSVPKSYSPKNLYHEDFVKLLRKIRKKMPDVEPEVYINYEPSSKRTGYLRGEVIVESWTETSLRVRFDTLPPLKRKLETDLEEALQAMSVNT